MIKPLKKLCLASGVALAFGAQADTFDITATVNNAITMTETTPFTLGSIYILAETGTAGTTTATLAIDDASGTSTGASDYTNPTSTIVALGGAQAGLIAISGAAPFTAITVTPSVATTDNLAHSSGSPAVPDIVWDSITAYNGANTALTATNTVGTNANTFTVTTNGTGDASIIVGGTFSAAAAATTDAYADGTYTGTYTIDVAY
ncbi:hypothetical protein [Halioxenophilus sp. WMMB6]|uniref:hypothetical protein n=1 Tax=Halioxenophilus sp. WMMB6 TaxID=3073815 RepID=UPI00295EE1D9|nr:hypothetical protein [Halioxenophilus sp. WMMB6]